MIYLSHNQNTIIGVDLSNLKNTEINNLLFYLNTLLFLFYLITNKSHTNNTQHTHINNTRHTQNVGLSLWSILCQKRFRTVYPGRRLRNPYTLVNDRIRPVFLRIRSNTIIYEEKRRPYMVSMYWASKRSFFSPYITVFLRIRHGDKRS